MSAGAFQSVTYVTNAALVTTVKVQPESLALVLATVANAAPTGTRTVGVPSAKVSGSKRKIGINARTVTIKFTGAVPTGYLPGSKVRIPVPSATVWNGYDTGQTGTYLGSPVVFAGKSAESIK